MKCWLLIASLLLNGGARAQEPSRPADMAALRALYAGSPDKWPRPVLQPDAVFAEFGPMPPIPASLDNPSTPEKIALGEMLFNEPKLSGSGQIACASCHNRELGFGDGIRTSFGHDRQRGNRNAQPLFAAAWMTSLFWDGRAPSLEAQAIASMTNPFEMAADPLIAVSRIAADPRYSTSYSRVFGDQKMKPDHVAQAIAAFVRTIRPRTSLWDRVIRGGTGIMNDSQLRGLHLFRTRAGCANCHNGPLFTDKRFHNIGLSFYGRRLQDLGRYEFTRAPTDVGAFRTPSLRGVSRSGPWMHNGLFPHLRGIVNFYNAGGVQPRQRPDQASDPLFPKTSPILKPLNLTRTERDDLVAFLETL